MEVLNVKQKKHMKVLFLLFCIISFLGCNQIHQEVNTNEAEDTIIIDEIESLLGADSRTNDAKVEQLDKCDVFPTQTEIEVVNAKLPALVSEGTLFTKVQYDDRTKVQTFYYRFTQEVDESQITKGTIRQLKSNMVAEVKNSTNNVIRLKAGMSFLYVYYSYDNRRLYEITINANDL